MIRINLLPHRELRRKQQQKEFFIVLGVVLGLGATIWFATHSYLNGQLEEQNGRNTYLETEIAALDKHIEEIARRDAADQREHQYAELRQRWPAADVLGVEPS